MAITADLGTLQRLPTIVGYGNAFEMAITGRRVGAEEAKAMGLVSRVFDSQEELIPSVNKIAEGNFFIVPVEKSHEVVAS